MEILTLDKKDLSLRLPSIVKDSLKTEVKEMSFIGGGSFGKVFKATLSDTRVIAVKAFIKKGGQFQEASQLRILSENTSVNMPEVLFEYADEKTAVMGMSFIEGENVLNPGFLLKSKEKKEKFARDVVSGMLGWHSVRGEKYGSLENPCYDTWLEYYKTEKQQPWLEALSELSDKGKYSKKSLELLKKATEIFDELAKEPDSPVLIHGDLNIMNIMADKKSFELTGFIDPCGSMWADREYDLFQLLNMWGTRYGIYEEYKRQYPLSDYSDFRVAYYGAMHEAAMRLSGGITVPLWEEMNNMRLKREMKKIR